ncbi:hypothetical protein KIN20_020512 [Parelaphostrongylus tenuis]|uniref:Uncharacterized protein n=1 Tax=Parelaphostrongylus tenuis TaxID=148309 RepID=A0AAD5N3A7_PARTN|nr:hypothetical protein KIN20_020512 [Parelaphostrongylus tenuis]
MALLAIYRRQFHCLFTQGGMNKCHEVSNGQTDINNLLDKIHINNSTQEPEEELSDTKS